MRRKLLLSLALVSALFAPAFASAATGPAPAWYDITFTGADVWTYSADNAVQSRLDQNAPRRYRDWTQENAYRSTTYGVNNQGAAGIDFNTWATGAGSGFAFDSINLWGAGGAAAATWGENYVSVGNSNPGFEGVSSWEVIQSPTGWTSGIVKGNEWYSADATHAFPVWRSGTGAALSQENMYDPSFVFKFRVLAVGAPTRVFFGGYSDDLQGAGPGNFEVSGVMAVPEPETYAMMLAGLGLLGFMARRRKQSGAAA